MAASTDDSTSASSTAYFSILREDHRLLSLAPEVLEGLLAAQPGINAAEVLFKEMEFFCDQVDNRNGFSRYRINMNYVDRPIPERFHLDAEVLASFPGGTLMAVELLTKRFFHSAFIFRGVTQYAHNGLRLPPGFVKHRNRFDQSLEQIILRHLKDNRYAWVGREEIMIKVKACRVPENLARYKVEHPERTRGVQFLLRKDVFPQSVHLLKELHSREYAEIVVEFVADHTLPDFPQELRYMIQELLYSKSFLVSKGVWRNDVRRKGAR